MRLQKLPQTESYNLRILPMGEPRLVQQYANGELQHSKWYSFGGSLGSSQAFKRGIKHGWFTEYFHQSNQMQYQSHYQNGLRNGPAIQWESKGLLLVHATFKQGTGFDCWIDWHDDADQYFLSEAGQYVNGTLDGFQRYYSKPGQLFEETYYDQAKIHGLKRTWNPDGSLQKSYPQLYFQGALIAYATQREEAQQFGFEYREADNCPIRTTAIPQSVEMYVPLALAK